MHIGFVGLGKMGANMVRRIRAAGHDVTGYSLDYDPSLGLESEGVHLTSTLAAVPAAVRAPRVIWIMVPAGDAVDETIRSLLPHLSADDLLVDGGNSFYRDTMRRADDLAAREMHYVDVGTSGGVWGLKEGFCMMVGGTDAAVARIHPLLEALAEGEGFLHVGPHGAGHYAKMIHNGIEYGLMAAYAEGFDILAHAPYSFDLEALSHLWNHGAVIRSWLLELVERMFAEDPQLDALKGYVRDSGTGRWTVKEAIDLAVPTPVIASALEARFRSRRENSFGDRFLAALRNQFGGHPVVTK